MTTVESISKEKSVLQERLNSQKSFLRWSGLAGILAGAFFVVTIFTLILFGPSTTATPAQLVKNFPNVSTGLAVGNSFYFLVSLSLVGLVIGLYRVLRRGNPFAALFGAVLFALGLGVTFIEDTTQFAFAPISNLYHAPGATPADQASLALMWQATQGMFNEFDTSATILLSAGMIVLGVAMFKTKVFGRVFAGLSIAIGAAQALAVTLISTNSAGYAPVALLAFLVFPVVFGWKLFRLSKASSWLPTNR